jgi:hypothetical protein
VAGGDGPMLAEVDSYEICRMSISGNKANLERKVPIGMTYTDAQKQEIKVAYEMLIGIEI